MNRNKFIDLWLEEDEEEDPRPESAEMAALLDEMREREQVRHCVPRARLFREASSGWDPDFHDTEHADYCEECESAAFIALHKRRPGLWAAAAEERNIKERPVWWTRAIERHLAEAPRPVQILAQASDRAEALKKSLGTGLAWAMASRQTTNEGSVPRRASWRSFLPEDGLLVVELRPPQPDQTSTEYLLTVTNRNLMKSQEREGCYVSVSIFGKEHRIDKAVLLERSGSLLEGKTEVTPEEMAYLDPDIEKGGLPGIALLEPELLIPVAPIGHCHLAALDDVPLDTQLANYKTSNVPELETGMQRELKSNPSEHLEVVGALISSNRTGLIWQRAQRCRHAAPQDREYMERVARAYQKRWNRPSGFRTQIFTPHKRQVFANVTLGNSDLVSVLPIESLDGAVTGPPLTAEILEAGKLTCDGHFQMKLRLKGDEVRCHEGKAFLCSLADEEARISFESSVQGGVALFDVEGLPHLPADVFPESFALTFYLIDSLSCEA